MAHSPAEEPEVSEPSRLEAFVVFGIVLGIVILIGMINKRVFGHRMEVTREQLDKLTLGLAKAGTIALFIYLSLKFVDIAMGDKWHLLTTSWGALYLTEVLGFVLLPCLVYAFAYRERKPGLARYTALWTVLGVIFNRLNIAVVAYNWHFSLEERYFPSWMEYVVVAFLITLGLVIFRLVAEFFPIVNHHPDFKESH